MTANTVPLTYNGYVTQIATLAIWQTTTNGAGAVVPVDQFYINLLPQMLNYAELRIQRDVDLLPLMITVSYTVPPGLNQLSISTDDLVTVEFMNVISGTDGFPMTQVAKPFIQNVYSNSTVTGIPQYFAAIGGDQATGGQALQYFQFGPYSDQSYQINVTGTQRAPSLYNSLVLTPNGTATTFISTYLPDLLIMASMVYISAAQRNFGRASDDPQMSVTFESQYQALLKGAVVEEARKKFQASGWSSMSPAAIATPTR